MAKKKTVVDITVPLRKEIDKLKSEADHLTRLLADKDELYQMSLKMAEGAAKKSEVMASTIETQRAKIDELKTHLAQAYATIARQDGYLTRALEDDAVREIGPAIPSPHHVEPPVSRRRGISDGVNFVDPLPDMMMSGRSGYGSSSDRRPAPKPWHNL